MSGCICRMSPRSSIIHPCRGEEVWLDRVLESLTNLTDVSERIDGSRARSLGKARRDHRPASRHRSRARWPRAIVGRNPVSPRWHKWNISISQVVVNRRSSRRCCSEPWALILRHGVLPANPPWNKPRRTGPRQTPFPPFPLHPFSLSPFPSKPHARLASPGRVFQR